MKSPLFSRLGNPILSAIVFFLTVGVLSVGYAAFSSLGSVNSGDMLTSALWNKMSANLDDLDARSAANTSGLSSLTTQVTTNTSGITAINTSLSSFAAQVNTLSGMVAANVSPWGKNGLAIYYTGGNVGVGTVSPQSKLDVLWWARINTLVFQDGSGTTYQDNWMGMSTNIDGLSNRWLHIGGITDNTDGHGAKRRIYFWANVASFPENVGIGTTNPWYRLEITTGAPGTQAKFGSNAYISTWSNDGAYFSNGATFNASGTWTARAIGASTIVNDVTGIRFLSNSWLTVGNTFAPTERMRIDQNGNVGIGIASPLVPLHVKGAISGDYLYINPQNSAIGEGGEITLMWATGKSNYTIDTLNDSFRVLNANAAISFNPFYINYAGNGYFAGATYATAYYNNSDRSLKKDIIPLNSALDKIRKLNGYYFSWKDTGRKDMGVIAQEVEQVFPEIVGTRESASGSTIKTVEYGNLVAPLIESVKELANKQDALEKENRELKLQMYNLDRKINP